MTKDEAANILRVRNALVAEDYEDAYHYLYAVADPKFISLFPWEWLEKLADDESLKMENYKKSKYREQIDDLEEIVQIQREEIRLLKYQISIMALK